MVRRMLIGMSSPLHLTDLKGKVVMVEFWPFGCYNCRNVEP